jgi:hypothetical protein
MRAGLLAAIGGYPGIMEALRREVWERADGRCECTRLHVGATDAPHHGGRCQARFPLQGRYWICPTSDDHPLDPDNAILLCRTCGQLHLH